MATHESAHKGFPERRTGECVRASFAVHRLQAFQRSICHPLEPSLLLSAVPELVFGKDKFAKFAANLLVDGVLCVEDNRTIHGICGLLQFQ